MRKKKEFLCHYIFRNKMLKKNQIAILPQNGYSCRGKRFGILRISQKNYLGNL
jgi:hypothetical protein